MPAALPSGEASPELLARFAECVPGFFWAWSRQPRERVSFVNAAFEAIWGMPAAALQANPRAWVDAVHADDRAAAAQAFDLWLNDPRAHAYTLEHRVLHADGDIRWVRVRGHAPRDGHPTDPCIGTGEDITEHRRDAEALAAAQQRLAAHDIEARAARKTAAHYRAIFSLMPEGIVVSDLQGNVISCNAAAARSAGVTEDQWRGKPALASGWTRTHADGRPMPPSDSPSGRVLAGGPAQHGVLTAAYGPEGQVYWLEVGAIPLHDPEDGKLVAIAAVFADVTRRKLQEDELIEHRHRLTELVAERTRDLEHANQALSKLERFSRTIIDNLVGSVAYWDADLRCRYVNRGFLEWVGSTTDQVLGHHAADIFGGYLSDEHLLRLQAALQGQAQHYDETVQHDGGKKSVYQVHLIPDQGDGQGTQGVYAMAYDISALMAAEAELRLASEAAATANRAKSAFLANMSHEIRTPMNAIIGLTHLMARDTRDSLQRERLAKVDTAAKHLLQIINDILDLSKIEAGKMTLEMAEFSLDSLLSRTFDLVSERAREKGLELVLDTDHLPKRMRGDATRLLQVLVNLLTNAVKFTAQGWVRVRGELLRQERTRLQVRFEVQDTGEGISREAQQHLFTAFEQADNTITRRHGGTGLGLALTRHMVSLMNGEVGVQSTVGCGSTFWFTAWLERANEAGEQAAPLPIEGLRALVVDDLREALASIGDRLTIMGLQVHTASSSAEALRQVETAMKAGTPYDLLLIDWRMPVMDGIDTYRQIQQVLQQGMPPAILVSAFDEPAMWQQARSVGFDAVLVKPITPSALHDTLMRVFRRQATLEPAVASQAGAAEATLRLRHAGQRVLVAEDNPINQEVAEELLRSAGLVVDVADDGERAVELVRCRTYDAVLMDMQMPGMDGMAAARAIRQLVGSGLPIIAMTANAFIDDRAACLEAGMNDHIAKPVDPADMYRTLLRWLPVRSQAGLSPMPAPAPLSPQRAALRDQALMQAGIDLERAMQSVNGQRPLLDRLLARFATTYAAGANDLVLAARSGELDICRQCCHSLQGACTAIGAEALARDVEAAELAFSQTAHDAAALCQRAETLNGALTALAHQLNLVLREFGGAALPPPG